MVIQQAVDARVRGHDGVYEAHHPLPVMLAAGEHPRLRRSTRVTQQGVDTRVRGHDGVYEAHHPLSVMLAEGEHPRLRRRTMVTQQGVDTRAKRGHDGVYEAAPLPVMLAAPLLVMLGLRRASTTSATHHGDPARRGYPPASGMTWGLALSTASLSAIRFLDGKPRKWSDWRLRTGNPCGSVRAAREALPPTPKRSPACCGSSVVEHSIGNGEVESSILSRSTS
jgi:hypothetical protein